MQDGKEKRTIKRRKYYYHYIHNKALRLFYYEKQHIGQNAAQQYKTYSTSQETKHEIANKVYNKFIAIYPAAENHLIKRCGGDGSV